MANLEVTFSEPVAVAGSWFSISCDTSGAHDASVSGGPTTYLLDPTADFVENESCMATIVAKNVTDLDTADPPDAMDADFSFTFTTADLNAPPTVDAGGPYVVVEGGSVTVSATGTDPDGDALTYAWDLDGNGTFEKPGASFVFSAAGIQAPATRTFSVQVTDPDGATGTDTATVSVVWAFDGFGPPLDSSGGINARQRRFDHPGQVQPRWQSGPGDLQGRLPGVRFVRLRVDPADRGERHPPPRANHSTTPRGRTSTPSPGRPTSRGRARVACSSWCSGTARSTPRPFQFSKATEVPVKKGTEAPGRTK